MSGDPKIGVALGGGAARGLTHIAFIKAMDELGVKPDIVAGSSIGALLGSGWAAGLAGEDIHDLAVDYLGSLRTILARIWSRRFSDIGKLLRNGLSLQLDPIEVIESFVPDDLPRDFAGLKVPFKIVSTDFFSWHQVVFSHGELLPAIASSVAIPTMFRPVVYQGRTMVDGSIINPLPLDLIRRQSDILIAVDVSGEPQEYLGTNLPSGMDMGWRAAQIMMHTLANNSMAAYPPDVYIRPPVEQFGALEFWRVREIVDVAREETEMFKRQVAAAIETFSADRQKSA